MKKTLLLMAMALFTFAGAYAQEEGEETAPIPVYTKSLTSVIEDAKFIVADSHYTKGQSDLQKAIDAAEASIATLADNDAVREAMTTLQTAIDQFITSNDYADATEKVQNPSFSIDANNSKTITSWTVKNFKQNRRDAAVYSTTRAESTFTYFAEQWIAAASGPLSGSGDISQVVKGLPAGHYRLTADVFAHNQKYDATCEEAVGIQLYANDVVREIGLTGLSDTHTAAFSLDFDVAEGQEPTIGFRFESTNVNWLGWDNITLYFIGDPEIYNNIVNVEKIAAAKEALAESVKAATEALANEDAPLYQTELKAAVDAANALTDAATLEELTEAKTNVDTELSTFNGYNKHYAALKTAIDEAEALIAGGMTNGADKFQEAINAAKTQLATAASDYTADAEGGAALTDTALDELKKAESSFRVLNASYANPANIITNGGMSSMDGWDVLSGGTKNPDLHINTSGNVTNFSTPFMECWANNTNYGLENYARQTVNALPNGQELPAGYYVLKAAALATRQDQASLKVSGVTLKFQDQIIEVQTANGVANIYTIGFQKDEPGGELSFGLYIDETTDANWIAWDEVELQFVGDKDKYVTDYTKAMLGESIDELKATLDKINKSLENFDLASIDFEDTDLYDYMDGAQFYLENPTAPETTKENIALQIKLLNDALDRFFTSGVSPKAGQYLDYTTLIKNADFDVEPGEEWTVETENGVLPTGTDCVSWWFGSTGPSELSQEFSQTVSGLPAGNYMLEVNAAIRVDMNYSTENYKAENLGKFVIYCKAYANDQEVDVHPFFYEDEEKGLTLEGMMEMTGDYDYRHGNGSLIDDMLKKSGNYILHIPFTLENEGNVKVGFKVEVAAKNGQMPFIDYFHLYYYGTAEPTAINGIAADNSEAPAGVYNLQGQYVGPTTKGLAKGLYIVGGQKVIIR